MRILMIEDDVDLCEAVRYALCREGYTVDVANDGDDGLRYLLEQAHELVLLDRMLPYMSGTAVLKKARSMGVQTPVLMITALGQVHERVEGLDCGADDYLVKPFAIEELLARIRAMQRRPRAIASVETVSYGDLTLDASTKRLQCGINASTLSKRECDLMEALLKSGGVTLKRSMLLCYVWGPDAPVEEGNLENYIHFLRRRLKSLSSTLSIITERGVGYRLAQKGD